MGQGEEDQTRGVSEEASNKHHYYGTFQGVSNYSPPQNSPPVTGFPQPPPQPTGYDSAASYNVCGYQTIAVYDIAEGRFVTVRQRRLPFCGIGLGWFLFIVGFFLSAIPWYVGLFRLMFGRRIDHREKPGYIACSIAAVFATIALIMSVSKGAEVW